MNCGRRAFEAGLRWAGRRPPFDLPPTGTVEDICEVARLHGLYAVTEGSFSFNILPVLVIYRDNFVATDSEYHAVFASDISPFKTWKINAIIYGWENLK